MTGAERDKYYRNETWKQVGIIALCILIIAAMILALISVFLNRLDFTLPEYRDILSVMAYLMLIGAMVRTAVSINEIFRLNDEKRGITQENKRKRSRSVYSIVLSLGAMLLLALVSYFSSPILQLEVRYGMKAGLVAKITKEENVAANAFDIYICEDKKDLLIDVYYRQSTSWFSSSYQNGQWLKSYADTGSIKDGKIYTEFYLIAARHLSEKSFSGLIDTEEYGELEVSVFPCRVGYVQTVIRRTDDPLWAHSEWYWLDLIDSWQAP